MEEQITVNLTEVEKIEKKLSALQRKTANRKVNVNFVNTKGDMADELVNAALELNEIGTTLTTLIAETKKVVQNAKNSFSNADRQSARLFE